MVNEYYLGVMIAMTVWHFEICSAQLMHPCPPGYFTDANMYCICLPHSAPAVANCAACTVPGVCDACNGGYYLESSSSCKQCYIAIPNCFQCHSVSNCHTCVANHFVLPGYNGFAAGCKHCQAEFGAECITCTTAAKCNDCVEFWGIGTNGSCFECPTIISNCYRCEDHTACLECQQFYGINSGTQTCDQCSVAMPNCYNCTVSHICGVCSASYGLNSSNLCQSCNTNIPFCEQCTYTSVCESCQYTYGLHPPANTQCSLCMSMMQYCVDCDNVSVCTECLNDDYTILISGSCLSCFDVPLCDQCDRNLVAPHIVCTSCQPEYYVNLTDFQCYPCFDEVYDCLECERVGMTEAIRCDLCTGIFEVDVNGTCKKCKDRTKFYVTRHCIDQIGCASISEIEGELKCLACDGQNLFVYEPETASCKCQEGYFLDYELLRCVSLCGNGIKTPGIQECDDGNLNQTDGCDETCKIEEYYQCQEDAEMRSTCVRHQNIEVHFLYTERWMGANAASMYFAIGPTSITLEEVVDWSKTITLDIDDAELKTVVYEDGLLVLDIGYLDHIEGQLANFSAVFDPEEVVSESTQLQINMEAVNGPLFYEGDFSTYRIISTGNLAVVAVAVLLLIFSVNLHKMIGLQTIQCLQLVYFVKILESSTAQTSFYAFNNLQYANGYNGIQFEQSPNRRMPKGQIYLTVPKTFVKMDLSLYFLDNVNLMLMVVAIAFLVFLVFAFKKMRYRSLYFEDEKQEMRDKYTRTRRTADWLYDHFVFPSLITLYFLINFSSVLFMEPLPESEATQSNDFSKSSTFQSISFTVNLVALLAVFWVFAAEIFYGTQKYLSIKKQSKTQNAENKLEHDNVAENDGTHPFYVPLYLLYQFTLLFLINLKNFRFVTEVVAGTILMYSLVVGFWGPYLLRPHNLAIVFNQLCVLTFLGLILLQKYGILEFEAFSYLMYLIMVWLVMVVTLAFFRLYFQSHSKVTNKDAKEKLKGDSKSEEQKIKLHERPDNRYLFRNQLAELKKKYLQANVDEDNQCRNVTDREILQFERRLNDRQGHGDMDALQNFKAKLRKEFEQLNNNPNVFAFPP